MCTLLRIITKAKLHFMTPYTFQYTGHAGPVRAVISCHTHVCTFIQLIYLIDKSKTKVTFEEDIGQSAI